MAGLADFQSALKMRDIIETIVKGVVEQVRPRIQYGTVTAIDRPKRKCSVQFVGETTSVSVAMGSVQPQSEGQVVRIDGVAGDRFVADVLGPIFNDMPMVNSIKLQSGGSLGAAINSKLQVMGPPVFNLSDTSIGWVNRLVCMGMGVGPEFVNAGYFDVRVPAEGSVITGVGTVASRNVLDAMIPLAAGENLWYIMPLGASSSVSIPANFRVTRYSGGSYVIPNNWMHIATCSGDAGTPRFYTCSGERDTVRLPTLLNGWVNYTDGFTECGYYKENGRVYLQGLVKSGTVSSTFTGSVFNLPSYYRPEKQTTFISTSSGTYGRVDVLANGDVRVVSGSSGYVELGQISFRAFK